VTRVGDGTAKNRRWRSAARADEGLTEALAVLGKRVAELRKSQGLTQEALAAATGIDARHVQDIEYGRSNLTFATLRALALALETTVGSLVDASSPDVESP